MGIIRRLKWKDEKGNETEHDLGVQASNVSVDASHLFVTDAEKQAWNSKPGSSDSVKENTVEFEAATTRANIMSGETLKVMMGKIHKVILDIATVAFSGSYTDLSNKPTIPSGAAASYAVANNDTTTAAGYVADARIVRTHGLEIDQLSSDLSSVRQSFQDGCNTIVAGCTTYGVAPAGNSPAQIVAAIAAIYNNRYNAGYSAKVPYVNTAYTLTGGQSYTIPVGYAPNCICIYVPYLSGTSYRGYAMALKNGSKYQMSDQSPGVINAGDIVDWNVTFSDTGVTFTAPKCILRGSIACEVFVG